jgi:multicomponent Na+:H+ antiporter subunit A
VTGVLIAVLAVATAVVLGAGRRLGRGSFAIAAIALAGAFVALLARVPEVLDGAVPTSRVVWVRAISLELLFRLDGFALVMALLVTGIGALVMLYASAYFAGDADRGRVTRFVGCFTLFAAAMLGLVVAADVWTLFVFWELTSVMSFLLIGLDDELPEARVAAQRALLVTGAGGLAMLGGFVCLANEAGTTTLHGILAAGPTSTTAQVGIALVLVGAFTKSAQFPFHFWLPGAMVAPTPVTAFLHSATMVNAGVLIVARFAPVFSEIGWWRPTLVVVGGVTMLVGGVAALRRTDAKQLLAFGTVSQLGFLMVLFGIGRWEATAAGVVLIVAHALFKSGLFLTIGTVEHATGSRDIRFVSGVGRALPGLAVVAALCTLSMIGIPPLLGFVGKESALAALEHGGGWVRVALVVVVTGSVLTTAYSIRMFVGLFGTKPEGNGIATVHHRPVWLLTGTVGVLGVISLLWGITVGRFGALLEVAAESLDPVAHLGLELWSGFHLPLLLSALIVLAGIAVAAVVKRADRPPAAAETMGQRVYGRTYSGLLEGSRRVTLVTQSGSLPVYLAVVFAVIVAALGVALAQGAGGDGSDPVLADSVLQAAVALLATVTSIAVVMSRRRFVSVLLLGGVGQALTVLFLMYGAPDLALTQFMVETLMIVAFVLVLRHLPEDYPAPPSWAPRALRVGIAVAVGVTVAGFALAAGSVDRPHDVTDRIEELSLPEAGGKNVVNVTIVDFRGIDTMGEITVFGIAALGVANLVARSRRSRRAGPSRLAKIGAGSMVFEQVTRMVFHLTLLVSVYIALRGHHAPGGGFAGGLIAGAAFVFRLLAGGSGGRTVIDRLSPTVLIGVGMLLAIGSGLTSLALGREFLETAIVHVQLPAIGDVKLVSAAIFDLGVYFLVIGVVVIVLTNLAARTGAGGSAREEVLTK